MTRIDNMRRYRALLGNEVQTLVEKFIAGGCTKEDGLVMSAKIDAIHQRQRLMNIEIDKLMAIQLGRKDAQVNVPLEFCNA
jgi:hypothetical protein